MAGDESEVLLVLASLNLDKMLDENDVRRYPDFYLRKSGLQFPDKKISALVWIKIQIWGLIECDDVQKAEHLLYGFAAKCLDSLTPFFARTCRYFSWLYSHLYDDLGEEYPMLASEINDPELLPYIKNRATPFFVCYRIMSG